MKHLLITLLTVFTIVAPALAQTVDPAAANAPVLAEGDRVELTLTAVEPVTAFAGTLRLRVGSQNLTYPISVGAGSAIEKRASFTFSFNDTRVAVDLSDSSGAPVLEFDGRYVDGLLRQNHSFVDVQKVTIPAARSSIALYKAFVDGAIEVKIGLTQYSAASRARFSLVDEAGNASAPQTYAGHGPDYSFVHTVDHSPLDAPFVLDVFSAGNEPVLTWHGSIDWLRGVGLSANVTNDPSAPTVIRSVEVIPLRVNNVTVFAVPNSLILGVIAPTQFSVPPNDGALAWKCQVCPDPVAPWNVRLMSAANAVGEWFVHNALWVAFAALGTTIAFVTGKRSSGGNQRTQTTTSESSPSPAPPAGDAGEHDAVTDPWEVA